jgi:hypothetical protein
MKNRATQVALTLGVAILAMPVLAQTAEIVTESTAAPVAYVYIQTNPGVMAHAAAANGQLSLVKGSPFPVSGQMEDIGGKFLISVGTTILHVYQIESNGGVGKQISQINTASYGGSECGATSGQGSVFDHTGKYLYVQLNTLNKCAAWQTYRVESNGFLQFLGDTEYYTSDEDGVIQSTVPTINSNDKFAYGAFPVGEHTGNRFCENGFLYLFCPSLSTFKQNSEGVLEQNFAFTETDPAAPSGWAYYPYGNSSPQADPSGHIAVLMDQLDGNGDAYARQLTSYTINPNGSISSNNVASDMPYVDIATYPLAVTMSMSPSGKILAAAGNLGLQLFYFNGAAEPSYYPGVSIPFSTDALDQVKWDSNNHLYALSYGSAQLHVYTVTPTNSAAEAPGSPYSLPKFPYGTRGMVVVPK